MQLPHYSQYIDVTDEEWKDRSCGVIALKTVMDYYLKDESPPIDELIERGLSLDAYVKGIGWNHAGLVKLAGLYGLTGRSFDWPLEGIDNNTAFSMLKEHLESCPVMVSIHKNLNPEKGGHLVVVTEIDNDVVSYLDSDSKERGRVRRSATIEKFLAGWKRRIIIIGR